MSFFTGIQTIFYRFCIALFIIEMTCCLFLWFDNNICLTKSIIEASSLGVDTGLRLFGNNSNIRNTQLIKKIFASSLLQKLNDEFWNQSILFWTIAPKNCFFLFTWLFKYARRKIRWAYIRGPDHSTVPWLSITGLGKSYQDTGKHLTSKCKRAPSPSC